MAYETDPTGIIFAVFSFLSFLVLIPPLVYHSINKNIPAISLIAWFIYKNIVGFINVLIWSGNNFHSVTQAPGYCDVTVRITSASNLGQLCATTCLIFNLYMVISAKSYKFLNVESKTKKTINVLMCWLNPVLVMGLSILAQASRYAIVRYRGCIPVYSYGFVSILLSSLWNVIWIIVAFIFATLTIVEYIKKRKDLNDLLKCSNSGLNTRKFARLIVFSLLIIVVLSPVVLIGFCSDLANAGSSMSRNAIPLTSPRWQKIVYVDEGSMSIVQKSIDIALSFCAFFLFGLGSEALKMYRRIFISVGLVKEQRFVQSVEEIQDFAKHSSLETTEDDEYHDYTPDDFNHYVVSVKNEKPNFVLPILRVQGSEKGSNYGLTSYESNPFQKH